MGGDDPASEAWLPEATLDPATRAWLTAEERRRDSQGGSIPVQTPDTAVSEDRFAPRSAPSHVHGAQSGVDAWTTHDAAARPGYPHTGDGSDADSSVAVQGDDPQQHAQQQPPLNDGWREPDEPRAASSNPPPDVDPTPAAPPRTYGVSHPPSWSTRPVTPPTPTAPSWWIDRAAPAEAGQDTDVGDREQAANRDGVDPDAASDDMSAGASSSTADVENQPAEEDLEGVSSEHAVAAGADENVADVGHRDPTPQQGSQQADVGADAPAAPFAAPRPGDTAAFPNASARRLQTPPPLVAPGAQGSVCHVCGRELQPDDIFCEECGAVRPAVTAAYTGPIVPLPAETPEWAKVLVSESDAESESESDAESESESDAPSASDEEPDPNVDGESVSDTGVEVGSDSGAGLTPTGDSAPSGGADSAVWAEVPWTAAAPSGSPAASESASAEVDGASPDSAAPAPLSDVDRLSAPEVVPAVPPVPVAPPMGSSPSWGAPPQVLAGSDDVEETRIVAGRSGRQGFVLHFSTGERVDVSGSGLIGRYPRPEVGEHFDTLVTLVDRGKSVSKTHLEFGRDDADLWVSDRHSGNGTAIRHIDGTIRECVPGRRYRVERGARVDIGEQFFLVQ